MAGSPTDSISPSVRLRLLLAACTGLLAAALVVIFYERAGPYAVSDWDATWTGAGVLLHGENPYAAITSPPWPDQLNYPLPAMVLSLPFSFLPLQVARAAFVAVGAALFAFMVTRRHLWGLYLVFSGAMLASCIPVQWAPLLVAATLSPTLGWILAAKPTMGSALWLAQPSRLAFAAGLALMVLSFAIRADWLTEWLASVAGNPHRPPVTRPGGFILLLALLRWRRPEGRLLGALSLVPQTTSVYETLPLALLVENRAQALYFALLTMIANALHHAGPQGPWPTGAEHQWWVLLAVVYLPAVVLLLRRPNVPAEIRF